MANTDKNILITPAVGSSTDDPKIVFQGANATVGAQSITLRVYPDNNGTLSFEGSAGQLFSITNDLTGSIFSVNDVSGIPSIDVNADGTVSIAKFSGNVSVGNVTPTAKFHVVGDLILDNIKLDDNTISTTNTNGNLILAPNGTGQITANTVINATSFVSNVATGTAPFTVTSTTLVANLNVATASTAGTVTTASQPNITSLGTLSALTVTGNVTVGNIIRSGGTSSQFLKADGSIDSTAYITSAAVGNGTLTLAVSGTGLSGSASFTANQSGNTTFTVTSNATNANTASAVVARDSSGNFSAGTITATLSGAATTAGTVTTAAQPNITSVGTLTSLGVSGAVTASTFTSNVATGTAPFTVTSTTQVANLSVATAATATSATTAGTVTTAAQPNITSVGTLTTLTTSGNATVGGNLTVTGNLTINGTTTSVNATTVDIADLNITVAKGSANAAVANGAGITVDGAAASLQYLSTPNAWAFDRAMGANGTITGTQLISNVATGTAPLQVTSTTLVPNLNVANATYATSAGSATSATSATTAGTVTTAAQPNITSLGTLTSLAVSGTTNLNAISNVTITGGTSGYVMTTNGSGTLSWTAPNALGGLLSVTSAAGTTILTVSSATNVLVTGTTTQTIQLPDVTTLTLGWSTLITNTSTGAVTVQSSGANAFANTIQTGMSALFTCIAITGTTTASWALQFTGANNRTGTGALVYNSAPVFTGTITAGNAAISGNITVTQLISNVATGTAPIVVTSTTQVANLNVAASGTSVTSSNLAGGSIGTIPYQSAANVTAMLAVGTAGQALVSNAAAAPVWTTLTLENLPDAWVKRSCRVATTAALTATFASGVLTNSGTLAALAIDGITLATNDRVLVKNQATAAQNGIYVVTNVGSASVAWVLTRSTDANTAVKIASSRVAIDSGTVNGGRTYDNDFKTTDTLNTTAMTWLRTLDYGTGVTYTASSTSPTGIAPGAEWYDTDDGSFWKYIFDGTTYQWVEWGPNNSLNGNELITGNILPNTNVTYNIGSPTVSLKDIYASTFNSVVATGTAPFTVQSTTQVANLNATFANTVTAAAQPNITSVGTLGNLQVTNAVGIGGATGTVDLTITANSGTYTDPSNHSGAGIYLINSNNASTTGHSIVAVRAGGAGGGDPFISMDISGVTGWSFGIDNSDSDSLKIANSWNDLATNTKMVIQTDGTMLYSGSIIPTINAGFTPSGGYNLGSSGFYWNTVYGRSASAQYADLAERYIADKQYPVGTVLMLGGTAEVTEAVKDSRAIAGTISKNPGFIMNDGLTGENVVPVAYIGRVPCRVFGKINIGDILIVGDTPGVAVAATDFSDLTGKIIGKAMQKNEAGEALIEIMVGRI